MWFKILIFLTLFAIVFIIMNFVSDRKYLKRKTRDTIDKNLLDDIYQEEQDFDKHKNAFSQALADAKKSDIKD